MQINTIIFQLHAKVSINKLHINIIMLHVDMIFLAWGAETCHHTRIKSDSIFLQVKKWSNRSLKKKGMIFFHIHKIIAIWYNKWFTVN